MLLYRALVAAGLWSLLLAAAACGGDEQPAAPCKPRERPCPLELGRTVAGPETPGVSGGADRYLVTVGAGKANLSLGVSGDRIPDVGLEEESGTSIVRLSSFVRPAVARPLGVEAGKRYLVAVWHEGRPYQLTVTAGEELYEVEPNNLEPRLRPLRSGDVVAGAVDEYRDSDHFALTVPADRRRLRFKLGVREEALTAPDDYWQLLLLVRDGQGKELGAFNMQTLGPVNVMEDGLDLPAAAAAGEQTLTLEIRAGGYAPPATRYDLTVHLDR
jgi:hypothetical protein